ncbi:hypothetical protein DEU56DRAFT_97013 [Suillus clintonianus]|uniref:uncharacterized protein n=1 Tax=Suillus clintonianus TaxID=1904413 RepID=UPI001B88110D|nr:uncharacterized protein DEU56DRAFT_97013 [Suillus clintonianus]KAG2121309.1 hypothetical protein DEU56DRAFT_97013 [Suillus clintonianus]
MYLTHPRSSWVLRIPIQINGPLSYHLCLNTLLCYSRSYLPLPSSVRLNIIMSNLPEPPPSLNEKLTARKVFQVIGAGIFLLAQIIYTISIAVIFTHLGSTIPTLKPFADYAAFYTLGARTVIFVAVFFFGCCWCIVRLVAPKRAGSIISEWNVKAQAPLSLEPSNEKLGRSWRIYFASMGAFNICNGLRLIFRSWKNPDASTSDLLTGIMVLILAAWSFHVAYTGRLPRHRGKNMTLGTHVSQSEADKVTPSEYKDDTITT